MNYTIQNKYLKATISTKGAELRELYDTDGAVGAAKGAGIGAGIYKDNNEAFSTLEKLAVIEPARQDEYTEAYELWKSNL